VASALLDGHHRALAAASRRDTFPCVTSTGSFAAYDAPVVRGARPGASAPLLRFDGPDVDLSASGLPEGARPWLRARARCSDRRWVWRDALVDDFDRRLGAAPPPVGDVAPNVDVEGAYATWRDLRTIYER
jgi:hypothetical protein